MVKVGLMCGREFSFPPAFIARVNELGKKEGVTADFVKLGGTKMGEPAEYRVIVDRISHEVEYYRGYLKHAVLQGTYVINNPFWWTADDKYFNYSVASKLGIAIPKTVLLPQKGYPADVDINSESLRNLTYPMDWDGLLDYVGRPAILKPYSGGGWKHVYKVNNQEELLEAYDKTSPYCMTLQEFIDFGQYVRCFTFGKTDILPVAYDPKERKYLVEHNFLSKELGARVVKDAQTINLALGYEMNTIEFAIKDGVPYAIDFLNPAPDFERDRITEFYFEHVVEKMSRLVIDRALRGNVANTWPRWEEMLGIGAAAGFTGAPRAAHATQSAPSGIHEAMKPARTPSPSPDPVEYWHELLRPMLKESPDFPKKFLRELKGAKLTFGNRVHCPFLRPFFLSPEDEDRVRHATEILARLGERVASLAVDDQSLFSQFHLRAEEERLVRLPAGGGPASTASRVDAFLLPEFLKFTEYNGESPAGSGYTETLSEIFRELQVMKEFAKKFEIHSYSLSAQLLDALIGTYRDWGATSQRPQMLIVDWREVPTWSEFEILKQRFEALQVPVVLADPRELEWDGKKLTAKGKKIDLVYRRVLINDIVARPKECEALVKAYEAQAVCVANNFRCKIPHVKAFFAVLTEQKNAKLFSSEELDVIQRHVPWTRVVEDVKTDHHDKPIALLDYIRKNQNDLVMKPSDEYGGTGVTLGWEVDAKQWEKSIHEALPGGKSAKEHGCWIVQEKIPMRRGEFPYIGANGKVEFRDMLVDLAPYMFRGKLAGFLTRLSASSLANVTSGGGQIPAFRVEPKRAEKVAGLGNS